MLLKLLYKSFSLYGHKKTVFQNMYNTALPICSFHKELARIPWISVKTILFVNSISSFRGSNSLQHLLSDKHWGSPTQGTARRYSHCWGLVGASYQQLMVVCTMFQSYLQAKFIVWVVSLPLSSVLSSDTAKEVKVKKPIFEKATRMRTGCRLL